MGNLFSKPAPAEAQQPDVKPPPPMPDPQSPDATAARRRAQESVMGRAGRSSTILSTAMSRGDSTPATYGSGKLGSST